MIARVRPVTKEDGEGPEATNAVTFDPDDDSIIHLLHKGKPVSFELDKVFSPRASQQDVSVAPGLGVTDREHWREGETERLIGKGRDSGAVDGKQCKSGGDRRGSTRVPPSFASGEKRGRKLRLRALEAEAGME